MPVTAISSIFCHRGTHFNIFVVFNKCFYTVQRLNEQTKTLSNECKQVQLTLTTYYLSDKTKQSLFHFNWYYKCIIVRDGNSKSAVHDTCVTARLPEVFIPLKPLTPKLTQWYPTQNFKTEVIVSPHRLYLTCLCTPVYVRRGGVSQFNFRQYDFV